MTDPTDLVATLREALADNYNPEWPWAVEIDFQDGYPAIYARNDELMEMSGVAWKLEGGKAAFIVAAVNALPGLLKESDEGRCAALANTYTAAREANG